jgi:hypothetical protein
VRGRDDDRQQVTACFSHVAHDALRGGHLLSRKILQLAIVIAIAACVAGCDSAPAGVSQPSFGGSVVRVDGLRLPARVVGDQVDLAIGNGFEPRFWAGVNLGSTIPGTFPGEVAASRTQYDRWLRAMGEIGVRLLRVYTILRPAFYDALLAYDRGHPAAPIYVLHGVWIPEEEFLSSGDAYSTTRLWRSELRDAVAVIHGDADLPARRGHASGRYRSDVARWVMGWSIGVEWDPIAAASTDRLHAGQPRHRGRYIESLPGSTPLETWIAAGLDYVARLEARRGWSRPLTFTNWLTTDPLHHPREPSAKEDLVSVDAMHLRATARWPAGFFASYHAYPYYPDFLRYEYPRTRRARDGKLDPYAGYLRALRRHHAGQAVMITEFGIPTAIGSAHRGPLGRDQGDHNEREAGAIEADLLRDIRDEGFAGGLKFEWIDEWFKFTWNTIDLEQPAGRRQLWRNPLTNEEHFGVVAAEAGERATMLLDGRDEDWTRGASQVIAESRGPVREVRATHDEEYLWLRLRFDRDEQWREGPVRVGFDVAPAGNRGLPGAVGIDPQADVAVTIGPGDQASLRWAAALDPLPFLYGIDHRYIPYDARADRPGSGVWRAPRLIMNRSYLVPGTSRRSPVELLDVSRLRWGTGDPAAEGFDQRALVDGHGKVLELRLPWSMLAFADPSSLRVLRPLADGRISTQPVQRVGITLAVPGAPPLVTGGYAWEPWNRVDFHERRKASWNALAQAFAETTSSSDRPDTAVRANP